MLGVIRLVASLLASTINLSNGDDCAFTIRIGDSMPSYALHSFDLAEMSDSNRSFCLSVETCTDCRFIVEMTRVCESNDSLEDEGCPGVIPYLLNNVEPDWEDCEVSSQQNLTHQRCHLIAALGRNETIFIVSWDKEKSNQESKMSSGLSVRVAEWMAKADVEYRLEVLNMNDLHLLVTEKATKDDLYVMLALPANRLKYLNLLASGVAKCEYDLWIGPMFNLDVDNSLKLLMHIRDAQPLYAAPLDSALYTLRVPSGCSPMLNLTLDPQMDWLNTVQIICTGEAFVATQAFHGVTVDRTEDYYLLRTIFCDLHPIDIDFSMTQMFDGTLNIYFIDHQSAPLYNETITIKSPRLFPFNATVRGIGAAGIRWDPKGPRNRGFIMNIHVSPSSFSPYSSSSVSSTTRKAATTTKPVTMSTTGVTTKSASDRTSTTTTTKTEIVTTTMPATATTATMSTVTGTTTTPQTSTITSIAIPRCSALLHLFSPILLYFGMH